MGKEKKMIQVDREVAEEIKAMYPDLSWNDILLKYILSKDSSKDLSKDLGSTYVTVKEFNALKDKFSLVITQLIDKNKLLK